MNGDAILKIAEQNPDVTIRDGVQRPSSRPDSTVGAKVGPQYHDGKESALERKFRHLWESLDCPPLKPEHKFDEGRRWRFDFAHIETQIAIEIEGGTHANGRHNRAKGYADDCEKYNHATLGGWQVYRLTTNMITEEWCNRIADAIRTTEEMTR